MNEQLQHLIESVKGSAESQVKAIYSLQKEIEAGNKQELIMDGIDLILDKERKGQNKKELDDVEEKISETNSILQSIQDGLAAWSQSWNDLFSSLKQTADDQLRIANQQLRLEDQSRVANEEARREAARAEEASPVAQAFTGGLAEGRQELSDTPGLKFGGGSLFSMFSAIAAVGAVAKLFDVDEFMRIPAYFVTFNKQLSAIAKGLGTMVAGLGKVGTFLSSIGSSVATFLKTSSTIAKIIGPIGRVLGKLALPITIIMGVLDGIGGFMKGYADTGSILTGIREAFVGILDGLVGTLVRFAGDVIAFIPDIIGLDAVAETIKDLFGDVVDGFMNMFRGVFDTVMGILTLDFDRLTDGLGNLLFGFVDTIQELLFAPFNLAINFFRDVFGFSEEDAPPFRVQDVILDTINSIADWFTNLFDFDLPSFEDIRRNFLPSWLGGGPNQEELQAELDDARGDASELRSAYAVSEDGSQLATSTSTKRTYQQDIEASEALIKEAGNKVATPEQREQMQLAADEKQAQAQAALDNFKPFDPLGAIGSAVSDMGSKAMGLGGQALSFAGDKAGQAKDAVVDGVGAAVDAADAAGEAFDAASAVVGNVVSDAITVVKDKAEALFDPIKNAFNSMIDTVKSIFDFGKIRDMLTNMFAEVGVPRVEFDVPMIGKVGFGPFYPFAPGQAQSAGGAGMSSDMIDTGSEISSEMSMGKPDEAGGDTFEKQRNSRTTNIQSVEGNSEEYLRELFPDASDEFIQSQMDDSSRGTSAIARESNTSDEGDSTRKTSKNLRASFDYETGEGSVAIQTLESLDTRVTDEFEQIEDSVKRFKVGPFVMSKVRRMIDAGATPTQVQEFLEENEKTIAGKISEFLSPVTNKAKDLAGQATEAATDVLYDAEDAIADAGSAVGDVATDAGYGAMDQVDKISSFMSGLFQQTRQAVTKNPFESLDEDTKDEIDAIRASLASLRGGVDSLGSGDALLEGEISQSPALKEAIATYVKDAADLAGMTPEEFLEAEKVLDAAGIDAGRTLNYDPDFDFDPFADNFDTVEPTPSKSLSAPVGQASQEVAAEKGSTTVVAPVSNSNANVSNNVNNNYNSQTIAPSAGPRSSDPTFQRVQNINHNGL